ncbi:hypothetical protein [Trueperella bernardiae]|uniref:hypothetical protein n=1 Tax=Trueperella bernardiae TaxID=59561 RepID=UPI002043BF45|nr:hypothetical protein [Trueperella bernardiae]MCM3906756.1 hypothetical protein [Trueperella bernardiae]
MDWTILAEAIASEVEQGERDELDAEVADLADAERATLTVGDRLRGAVGASIEVAVRGLVLDGVVEAVGEGWFLLTDATHEHIVLTEAVVILSRVSWAQTPGSGLPVSVGSFVRQLQDTYVALRGPDVNVAGRVVGVGRDHLLIEEEGGDRYGSYAQPWEARYDFGQRERLSQIVIPIDAIAVMSQARVNRGV